MTTTRLTHTKIKLSDEFEKLLERTLSNVDGQNEVFILEEEEFEDLIDQLTCYYREKYKKDIATIRKLLKKKDRYDIWIQ